MRTLYFGGSFNPVHHGHLACARAVAEGAGFDQVVLIPNQQSPHKGGVADIAPAHDRLAMCRLAVACDPRFAVDDLELHRPAPSFTITTARQLSARGEPNVCWLIGADQVSFLPLWHDATALLAEVQFYVMARPGWSFNWSERPPAIQPLERRVVTAPLMEISSTDIRRRVRAGLPVRYLTPTTVADYIEQHRLYRAG
jgi:nicotinate-nucleotide adenylyltransferase